MISVLTPSIRFEELLLTLESLEKQTFKDFEWIICSPFNPLFSEEFEDLPFKVIHVDEPQKMIGDFMGENKAYNAMFKVISGDLVVTLNDSIYLEPNGLQKFWDYFQKDPMSCVCFMGNHYEKVIDGKGINETYFDVRQDQVFSRLQPTGIINFDACCSSIPALAIKEIGRIDPIWDKFCCFGMRELMWKVVELGYKLFVSTESYYLGQKHTKEYDKESLWDQKFKEGEILFRKMYGVPY